MLGGGWPGANSNGASHGPGRSGPAAWREAGVVAKPKVLIPLTSNYKGLPTANLPLPLGTPCDYPMFAAAKPRSCGGIEERPRAGAKAA